MTSFKTPGGARPPLASVKQAVAQRTIELIFFSHIEQADWADQVLARHGIGRPHHRVLYFSYKYPGISVRELMGILRITNQALARTTNQLVELGFLEQRYAKTDRRLRQHFVTAAGAALLAKLSRHQVDAVAKSMETLSVETIEQMWFGLEALTRPEDRKWLMPRPELRVEADAGKAKLAHLKRVAGAD